MSLAIVTGAGSGIGQATAVRLAARGLTVLCTGRTESTLLHTCSLIQANGGSARALVADSGSPAGVQQVIDAVGTQEVTTLVHSAGRDIARPFADMQVQDLDEMWRTNVAGPYFLTQRLLPRMVRGGSVVFVGSISAARGRDRHSGYGATKAALVGLTVNLAVELAPHVRVNCVSPGATRTAMLKAYIADATRGLAADEVERMRISDASRSLLARVAQPDEVAVTVVHLALDATATTGVDVPVDLGYSAS